MKDDPDTNIKFVQTVQMYPCLYDYSTKDYSNRNKQDMAWGEIGKKFDANMAECKERWKNLRDCFTIYLIVEPPSGSAAKFKKHYYLAEFLNFLEPFTKSREQSGNMQVPRSSNNECIGKDECTGNVSENEEDNIDINLIIEDTPDTNKLNDTNSCFIESSPQQSTSSTKKLFVQKKQRPVGLNHVNKAALDFFSKRKIIDNMEEDVDLYFFKSVLPDMKLMNSEQKRRFKVGILNLAGSILNKQISSVTQQIGNQVNYSTSSNLSSSSASTPISPPLNLAQQSSSLHQNNFQD